MTFIVDRQGAGGVASRLPFPSGQDPVRTSVHNQFDSLESAYQYVSILGEVLEEAVKDIAHEAELAHGASATRRVDALQLVAFKLERLRHHLDGSRRTLNDLRMLRRLLLTADDGNVSDPVSYNQGDALARDSH